MFAEILGGLHYSKTEMREAWFDRAEKTDRISADRTHSLKDALARVKAIAAAGMWNLQWLENLFSFMEHGQSPYEHQVSEEDESSSIRSLAWQAFMSVCESCVASCGSDALASSLDVKRDMGAQNSDLQKNAIASLRQAVQLANGNREARILKQTLHGSITPSVLEYINALEADSDETCAENLEFHFNILCSWLANIVEISDYAVSLPWRGVLAAQETLWQDLLEHTRAEWEFVQVLDKLPAKHYLVRVFPWTRMQVSREFYMEAEPLNLYVSCSYISS